MECFHLHLLSTTLLVHKGFQLLLHGTNPFSRTYLIGVLIVPSWAENMTPKDVNHRLPGGWRHWLRQKSHTLKPSLYFSVCGSAGTRSAIIGQRKGSPTVTQERIVGVLFFLTNCRMQRSMHVFI